MAVNKIEYGTKVLIDLTADTVSEDTLFDGVTSHDATGQIITGNFPIQEVGTQANLIDQIKTALEGKAAGSGDGTSDNYNDGYNDGYADGEAAGKNECQAKHQPSKTVITNGTVLPDAPYTALSQVIVDVPTEGGDFDGIALLGSGQCGESAYYEIYEDGRLIISGSGTTYSYAEDVGGELPFVGECPFYYQNYDINTVIIEEGIEGIGSCLFYNHLDLTNVIIPTSVAYIGSSAFFCALELDQIQVVYLGTKEQWDNIAILENNDRLFAMPLICEYSYNGSSGSGGEEKPYTRVGYVQFNADLRFDTGVICNQNTKLKVVYTRDSSGSMHLYGVASSDNTKSVTAYLSGSGGTWRFGNKSQSIGITTNEDLVQTAIVDKSGIVRVDTSTTFSSVNNFESVGSLLIGASRSATGGLGAAQFIGKIYEFKMYDGDNLILDFEPCIDNNGAYGFYDSVSDRFVAPISSKSIGEVVIDE